MIQASREHLELIRSLMLRRQLDEEDDIKDDVNYFATLLSNLFLFFLIFGLSATVDVKHLKQQLTNVFAIGCGVLMQFLIMPALGFLAVMALRDYGLTKGMGIALLVVTSSPGGSYSNWWCSLFNAELALSVAMTTVSSILSLGLLPGNLMLYTYLCYGVADDESVMEALNFTALFTSLGIVLAAIITGLAAGYRFDSPDFHKIANHFGSLCGLLLIVFSLFLSSGGDGSESTFWNQPWAFYVGVAGPCLVGMVLANLLSRAVNLNPPETVAIAIECCYQNTGIATSIAITMFTDVEERSQAVAVPLFYGAVEALAIGIYCVVAWKMGWTKAPADENICIVLGKTYEVEENETDTSGVTDPSETEPETGRFPSIRRSTILEHETPKNFWDAVIFWRRPHPEMVSPPSHRNSGTVKSSGKASLDSSRCRFVSADYTAETSQCSTPGTPPPSDHRPTVSSVSILQTLTIPESPLREVEE